MSQVNSRASIDPRDSVSNISIDQESELSSDEASTSDHRPSKKRKRKIRNPVWEYCRLPTGFDEQYTIKSGKTTRRVFYCSFPDCKYSVLSTSSAIVHLQNAHNVKIGQAAISRTRSNIQQDIRTVVSQQEMKRRQAEDDTARSVLRQAANPALIQQALLRLIVRHDLPFNAVEWAELHTFINVINHEASHCVWTSHQTTANRIARAFVIRRPQVKQSLKEAQSLIHLTTGTWHSPNNKELQAITAHWVDCKGVLRKALLALPEMTDGHGGAEVAAQILKTLDQYDIRDRLGFITADNHGANDTLCDALEQELDNWSKAERRLRCLGHIINLAVQSFLLAKNKAAARQAVQYVENNSQSHTIGEAFEQLSEDDDNAGWVNTPAIKKLLGFQSSLRRNDRLFNAFKRSAGKSIREPNDTRWNSYYNCFQDSVELRAAYTAFVIDHAAFHEYELTTLDWHTVETTIKFLRPFQEATKSCEGDYVTLDDVQAHMDWLCSHIKEQQETHKGNPRLSESIMSCWYAFDKYYSILDKTSAYVTALLLHPSYRKAYLQAAWKKDWIAPSIKSAQDLWKHYKKVDVIETEESPNLTGIALFHAKLAAKQRQGKGGGLDEFDRFINGDSEPIEGSPLDWWLKSHQQRSYPQLSKLAIDVLSCPAMSAESERVFSGARRLLPWTRARLSARLIEQVECLKHWQTSGLVDDLFQADSAADVSSHSLNDDCDGANDAG